MKMVLQNPNLNELLNSTLENIKTYKTIELE